MLNTNNRKAHLKTNPPRPFLSILLPWVTRTRNAACYSHGANHYQEARISRTNAFLHTDKKCSFYNSSTR